MNTYNVKMGGSAPRAKKPQRRSGPAPKGTSYTGRNTVGGAIRKGSLPLVHGKRPHVKKTHFDEVL